MIVNMEIAILLTLVAVLIVIVIGLVIYTINLHKKIGVYKNTNQKINNEMKNCKKLNQKDYGNYYINLKW